MLGFPPHPTDAFIMFGDRDAKKKSDKMRQAYDKIAAAGHASELDALLSAVVDYAEENAQRRADEEAAGEDL